MKKCTLCIDRIYNDNLAPEERQPACVMVCPTHARFYGDLGDPASAVSELVAERGGRDLMPELGEWSARRAITLSGGQQKMVALARAFVNGRKLLLLDEPFEGISTALSRFRPSRTEGFTRIGSSTTRSSSRARRRRTISSGSSSCTAASCSTATRARGNRR